MNKPVFLEKLLLCIKGMLQYWMTRRIVENIRKSIFSSRKVILNRLDKICMN